jgi:hypothetical protein
VALGLGDEGPTVILMTHRTWDDRDRIVVAAMAVEAGGRRRRMTATVTATAGLAYVLEVGEGARMAAGTGCRAVKDPKLVCTWCS